MNRTDPEFIFSEDRSQTLVSEDKHSCVYCGIRSKCLLSVNAFVEVVPLLASIYIPVSSSAVSVSLCLFMDFLFLYAPFSIYILWVLLSQ